MTIRGQDGNGRKGNGIEAGTTAQDLFAALESKGLLADTGQAEELARGLGMIEASADPTLTAGAGPDDSSFSPTPITDNAMVVLEKRYLRKNAEFEIIEDPEGMFRRVAKTASICRIAFVNPGSTIPGPLRPSLFENDCTLRRHGCFLRPSE